ncbi:MAG TPA: hypothetical protein VIH99_06155 [Bdellovibrionota bacterium]|jgi:hypothetical protein
MRFPVFFFFLFFLTAPVEAHGAFCEEYELVADRVVQWDLGSDFSQSVPLAAIYGGELHPSQVRLQLSSRGDGLLHGSYVRSTEGGAFGYEYNIARLTIEIGDETIDQDYTGGCVDPAQGLFPGHRLDLLPIPVKSRGLQPVHIRVWGR